MIKKKRMHLLFMVILILLSFSSEVFATAWDPNMGGGGGGGGTGTPGNKWTSRWDGFRVTFIENNSSHRAGTISVDLTNYDFSGITVRNCQTGGGEDNRFYYGSGGGLPINVNHRCFNPSVPLPNVIGDYGDINAVRARFTDAGTIKGIVQKYIYSQNTYGYRTWDELYDSLIDGTYSGSTFIPNYKLLIEPIAYFYYDYNLYAMTAAEAAKFQQTYGNGIAQNMGSLTRRMLPISMYLPAADSRVQLSAYPNMPSVISNKNHRFDPADILNYGVGCGLISPADWRDPPYVDLTASASANKTSFSSGETVTINATVSNLGDITAQATHTSLKERWGKWDGTDAIQVQRNYTNSLSVGGSQDMTFTFTAPTVTSPTTYYLAVTADCYDVISESDEGNNAGYVTITVNPYSDKPDLVATSLTFDKSTYYVGETIKATYTIQNQGSVTAYNFYNQFRDKPPSFPEYYFYEEEAAQTRLWPGQSATYTVKFTAPTWLTEEIDVGFWGIADRYNDVAESNEDNNLAYKVITLKPALPDLTVLSLTSDKSTYYSGDKASFTMVVKNQGNADANNYTNRVRDLMLQGNSRFFCENKSGQSLKAGQSTTLTFTVTMPTVTSSIFMPIIGETDGGNVITESNEDNNSKKISITLNPAPSEAADLTIVSLSPDKSQYNPGAKATFTMVVKNQGTATAQNFVNRLQCEGLGINEEITVGSLSPGNTVTITYKNIPMECYDTVDSTFTINGYTNPDGTVYETDYNNNSATCKVLIKADLPDLSLSIYPNKTEYKSGETVQITTYISNIGIGTAGIFAIRLYDFVDSTPKYIDKTISTVSSLLPGKKVTYSWSFTAPNVSTTTFLYLRGDANPATSSPRLKETYYTNNIADTVIIIRPNAADLDIDFDEEANGTYYTDTTVITPAKVWSSLDVLPDDPGAVTFTFYKEDGTFWDQVSLDDVICPEGENQLVWSKWRTPEEPQTMNMEIAWTAAGGSVTKEFPLEIVELEEHTPPDTTATDQRPAGFHPTVPDSSKIEKTSNSWTVWEYNSGWIQNTYTAELSCTLDISPHESSPTATGDAMKSGYGVALEGTAEIVSDADDSALSAPGIGIAYFPEFNYGDEYYRVLEVMEGSDTYSDLIFQTNPLDHYNGRIHFTPIYYPDGPYTVFAKYKVAYSPGGELVWCGTDDVTIDGDLFDDWSVTPANP